MFFGRGNVEELAGPGGRHRGVEVCDGDFILLFGEENKGKCSGLGVKEGHGVALSSLEVEWEGSKGARKLHGCGVRGEVMEIIVGARPFCQEEGKGTVLRNEGTREAKRLKEGGRAGGACFEIEEGLDAL
jgi:hypothetical protein